MEIDKIIKEIRKKNNLTQKDLADELNVTHQAVSKWENKTNIPDIEIIKKISDTYNIDINILLGSKKKKEKKYLLIVIPFIIILLSIFIFKNKYTFKNVTSNCTDFNIYGSVVTLLNKSTIHISKVEYCGNQDETVYKEITSTLYESFKNIDKKIATSKEKDLTLSYYLEHLSYYIDDYKLSCKDSKLFIQINTLDSNNKISSYNIPINMDNMCSSTMS